MSSLPPLHKTKVVRQTRSSRLSTIPSSTASATRSRISSVKTQSAVGTSRKSSQVHAASATSRAAMWAEALQSTHPPVHTSVGNGHGNATPGAPPVLQGGGGNNNTGVQAVKQQARQVAIKVIESKLLTALVVLLCTILMLVCINPPMAQQQLTPEDLQDGVQAARSWKKIMVWSLLVFVVALLFPVAAGYWRPAAAVSSE